MKIVKVDINKVKNWEHNPRKIKPKDFERLKYQLKKLGTYKPLIAVENGEDYTVLGGNMRLKAYRELGITSVELSIVDAPTEEQKTEYALSDNDAIGQYDIDLLKNLSLNVDLKQIELDKFQVNISKSNDVNLSQVLDRLELQNLDNEDILNNIPSFGRVKVESKDIWQLGRHRLVCGDASKKNDIEILMNNNKADMVFTDPPYGVSYGSKNAFLNTIARGNRIQKEIENDTHNSQDMKSFWIKCWNNMNDMLKNGGAYYICSAQGGELMMMMMMSIIEAQLLLKSCLIWVKNNHVLGRSDYQYQHESILYGWKPGASHYFSGDAIKTSVWNVDKPLKSDLHPTMKPIELISKAIVNSSKKGEIVLDIFLGSGSTLIACEKLNRVCYGMEIDPHYCNVIIKRWETMTKQKAIKL